MSNKPNDPLNTLLGSKNPENETKSEQKAVAEPTHDMSKIQELAFKLFAQRDRGYGSTAIAVACFRSAESFIAAAESYKQGVYDLSPEDEVLVDCSFKNLPANNPHNVVSRDRGNIEKCIQMLQALLKEPGRAEFPEYGWDKYETRTARQILPPVVERYTASHASVN